MDIEEETLRASTNMGRQDVHEVPHLFILRCCILGLFGLGIEEHLKEPVVRVPKQDGGEQSILRGSTSTKVLRKRAEREGFSSPLVIYR